MATFFMVLAIIEWAGGAIGFAWCAGKFGIVVGLIAAVGAFIGGMFCMAIKTIITNQEYIIRKQNNLEQKLDLLKNEYGTGNNEPFEEKQRDSSQIWVCHECGETNDTSLLTCKGCGSYR